MLKTLNFLTSFDINIPMIKESSAAIPANSESIVADLAVLSLYVYGGADAPPLPDGWSVFERFQSTHTDYYGICFIKDMENPAGPSYIIFAHRGTVPSDIAHLLGDLQVAMEKVPLQFNSAMDFMKNLLGPNGSIPKKYTYDKLIKTTYIQTGHSLGAVIADLVKAFNMLLGGSCITFENPGSKAIIIKALTDASLPQDAINKTLEIFSENCHTYLGHLNAINTCNEQAVKCWELTNLPYDYSVYLDATIGLIPVSPLLNLNYLAYSFEQHRMKNIKEYVQQPNAAVNPVNYPFGIKQGYGAYLNPTREYWIDYAKEIWKRSEFVRQTFKNKYEDFYAYFNKDLTTTWKEVTGANSYATHSEAAAAAQFGTFRPDPALSASVNEVIKDFEVLENPTSEVSSEGKGKSWCSIS